MFETTRDDVGYRWATSDADVAPVNRFILEEAHRMAGTLHAPAVVALGKLKIHLADEARDLESLRLPRSCFASTLICAVPAPGTDAPTAGRTPWSQ